ncbi:MAG: hypothetical protein GEU73_07800 [Chloroflexi bacterium]|nr:hypothetical protein [Chloroflexota bacterium]
MTQPAAVSIVADHAVTGGGVTNIVHIRIYTPSGVEVLTVDADTARGLANQILGALPQPTPPPPLSRPRPGWWWSW